MVTVADINGSLNCIKKPKKAVHLPKSFEMPLNTGVSIREVSCRHLPYTSLIPPSYLPMHLKQNAPFSAKCKRRLKGGIREV